MANGDSVDPDSSAIRAVVFRFYSIFAFLTTRLLRVNMQNIWRSEKNAGR